MSRSIKKGPFIQPVLLKRVQEFKYLLLLPEGVTTASGSGGKPA